MLLVVALLGVGLTRAVEVDATLAQRDKEMQLRAIGREFRAAIAHYHDAKVGGLQQYPASLEDLLQDARAPGVLRHLRRLYADPMTGKADWVPVTLDGRIVGVHSASAAHPVKQAGFDADELGFEGREHYTEWVFGAAGELPVAAPDSPASAPAAASSPFAPGPASSMPAPSNP